MCALTILRFGNSSSEYGVSIREHIPSRGMLAVRNCHAEEREAFATKHLACLT